MAKHRKEDDEAINKYAARKKVLSELNKRYGDNTVTKYSDWTGGPIEVIPTGSLSLDIALGRGGYPRGRIIELMGYEAAGKSTLALHAIAECQRLGGTVAYIDAECALDPEYAEALGVQMDELVLSQPNGGGEEALQIAQELVSSGAFDMLVIDSVAALVPLSEMEGDMGKPQMGAHARLMSQALRKLTPLVHKSKCVLFFINQYRQKIGVLFGPSETTTGGNALKFYASVRMEIRKGKAILNGDTMLGNIHHVRVVKNKVAAPYKRAEFNIIYGKGIDRQGEVFQLGLAHNLIERSGPWYSYQNERIGQGGEAARTWFQEHPVALAKLEKNVSEALGMNPLLDNSDREDREIA